MGTKYQSQHEVYLVYHASAVVDTSLDSTLHSVKCRLKRLAVFYIVQFLFLIIVLILVYLLIEVRLSRDSNFHSLVYFFISNGKAYGIFCSIASTSLVKELC